MECKAATVEIAMGCMAATVEPPVTPDALFDFGHSPLPLQLLLLLLSSPLCSDADKVDFIWASPLSALRKVDIRSQAHRMKLNCKDRCITNQVTSFPWEPWF